MTAYATELAARLPVVAPDLRFAVGRRGENFGLDEQFRLPFDVVRSGARFVHFLALYTPLVLPRPFALTIHDLIHLRFPQYFKRSVGPYYATVVRRACARAARVITDDPRTADDLERLLRVDSRKIRVIPLGVSDAFFADVAAEGAERPYFLYAGNHRAHKDLATLVAAWAALPPGDAVDLALTGEADDAALRAAPQPNRTLRFLGNVGEQRLAHLYRGATAYVHPALCEGFGLPMLEAAAAGTRVIACDAALPGVLAGHAQTFAAHDAAALSGLLHAALERPLGAAQANVQRALARRYTWDRCARATAEVYREMLAEVSRR